VFTNNIVQFKFAANFYQQLLYQMMLFALKAPAPFHWAPAATPVLV